MAVTRVLDEEDRRVLKMLRESGLEEQAKRFEGLLRGESSFMLRPSVVSGSIQGASTVADVAKRLGLTRKEVRRHVEIGLLAGEIDPETGEFLVSNASIEWLLDTRRELATIVPFPWENDEPIDPNSLLGQMMAANSSNEVNDEE